MILPHFKEDDRGIRRRDIISIVNGYVGFDSDVLSILTHAAKKGRFEEFMGKLIGHYQENVRHIGPEDRNIGELLTVRKAREYFDRCYKILGVDLDE